VTTVAPATAQAAELLERLGVDPSRVAEGDLAVRTPITGEEIGRIARTDAAGADAAVERAVTHRRLHPVPVAPDAHDLPGERMGANRLGERAAQQSDADDRQAIDHAELFPSTTRSALIRRRFSWGVPMVTRSADSMPKGVSGRTITPSLSSRW